MIAQAEWLLIGAVAAVGVLHTIVPDHWVPITLIARQQGWRKWDVARAALVAGTGHTVSTLLIGLVVWIAGVAFATKFGNLVSIVSSIALIAFGAWIAFSSLRELRAGDGHGHAHDHGPDTWRRDDVASAPPPDHDHDHEHGRKPKRSARTTLLLILGSSPMVEGVPAFFAAGKYGPALIAVMAVAFALATISTYVTLCVASVAGLQNVRLGSLERYGEVLSGAFIAVIGLVFLVFPVL